MADDTELESLRMAIIAMIGPLGYHVLEKFEGKELFDKVLNTAIDSIHRQEQRKNKAYDR